MSWALARPCARCGGLEMLQVDVRDGASRWFLQACQHCGDVVWYAERPPESGWTCARCQRGERLQMGQRGPRKRGATSLELLLDEPVNLETPICQRCGLVAHARPAAGRVHERLRGACEISLPGTERRSTGGPYR